MDQTVATVPNGLSLTHEKKNSSVFIYFLFARRSSLYTYYSLPIYLRLCIPMLNNRRSSSFLILYAVVELLGRGSAGRKAATYTQDNTNT
jgi:hypothetical protein